MPSLRELQDRMMTALLQDTPQTATALVAAPPGTAARQLAIYANTMRSNFTAALRSTYPVIHRLVGAEYFAQSARDFQRRHPSPSGDLTWAGEAFCAYLAELHATDEYRYLADVARFEWLIQESLLAADHAPLDLQKMAGVAASAYDTLRFELHPALRLFESPYPVLRIWEANVADAEPDSIDLGGGAERVLVMRRRLRLEVELLSAGEYRLLQEFHRGAAFAAAVDAAAACDAQFDAAAALQRFVAGEALVDFA